MAFFFVFIILNISIYGMVTCKNRAKSGFPHIKTFTNNFYQAVYQITTCKKNNPKYQKEIKFKYSKPEILNTVK